MPRIARAVAIDYPHHITQRGNFHQNVFNDDEDRQNYLLWVQNYSNKYVLSILSYCLMSNHVHFIVIPHKEDSLARTFNTAHMCYAQYANKKMRRSGHLWQGRFFSCILEEQHLIMAARYVERNPVRANLVSKPWQWHWSSAGAHTGKGEALIAIDNLFNFVDIKATEWGKYIEESEDASLINNIKKHTLVGRPLGDDQFIEKLSKNMGRRFPALSKGRPSQKGKIK